MGERHRTSPLAKIQNTTLDNGHAAIVSLIAVLTIVTMSVTTARVPPMKPARSPASSGFVERTAAITPAGERSDYDDATADSRL